MHEAVQKHAVVVQKVDVEVEGVLLKLKPTYEAQGDVIKVLYTILTVFVVPNTSAYPITLIVKCAGLA